MRIKLRVENIFAFGFFSGEFGDFFFRIPVPLYLQHSEAITLVFIWYLTILQFLCLLGRGWEGLGVKVRGVDGEGWGS